MGSKLDTYLRKRVFLVLFCSRRTPYIVRNNARKFTPVGRPISYMGLILFSKIFYVFVVVYVKSNSISCEFSGLNVVATLQRKRRDLYDYIS